eukprot:TRINITY_DN14414_c0_g1_i1.p1 TRINITY_DN14414_c0_g1~~TRINITY_DN14414_c0_g1_i1.p1  ORF type:complete len:445 (-),score=45.44 TRINITY_DN14414_c0_g1_i1:1040-2353(-)
MDPLFTEQFAKLQSLLDHGYIDDAEFDKRKKALVDSFVTGGQLADQAPPSQEGAPPDLPVASFQETTQRTTAEAEPDEVWVRVRGLPFNATEADVVQFFTGFQIDPTDGVRFKVNAEGKQTGQAYVKFTSSHEAQRSLSRNNQYMGMRYVEVFPCTATEVLAKTTPVGPSGWVRLRGLPFSCTVGDIADFFNGFAFDQQLIHLPVHPSGRPTGEAFVLFQDFTEAQRALQKDRQMIGNRYIELFLSSYEDVASTLGRASRDRDLDRSRARNTFQHPPHHQYHPPAHHPPPSHGHYLPPEYIPPPQFADHYPPTQNFQTSYEVGYIPPHVSPPHAIPGASEPIVRLRGIPFRASEADIREFFRGITIPPGGVYVVWSGGRPSGEAFVEFRTRQAADQALLRNRQLMGPRYVEVFPSSRAELQTRNVAPASDSSQYYAQ